MDLQRASNYMPSAEDYPAPPRVHWIVLLAAGIVLAITFAVIAPARYQNLLNSLVFDGWVFYICLWIRKLNPDSNSIFWCDVYAILELSCAIISINEHPSPQLDFISSLLALASGILGLVTLYIIRAELEKHYNEREPIGIYLGPVQTFFFSFLYFQSQLYPIAKFKKQQAEGVAAGSGGSLLS